MRHARVLRSYVTSVAHESRLRRMRACYLETGRFASRMYWRTFKEWEEIAKYVHMDLIAQTSADVVALHHEAFSASVLRFARCMTLAQLMNFARASSDYITHMPDVKACTQLLAANTNYDAQWLHASGVSTDIMVLARRFTHKELRALRVELMPFEFAISRNPFATPMWAAILRHDGDRDAMRRFLEDSETIRFLLARRGQHTYYYYSPWFAYELPYCTKIFPNPTCKMTVFVPRHTHASDMRARYIQHAWRARQWRRVEREIHAAFPDDIAHMVIAYLA